MSTDPRDTSNLCRAIKACNRRPKYLSCRDVRFKVIFYHSDDAAWNPEDYDGVGALSFPEGSFWAPPVVMLDVVEVTYDAFGGQAVEHNGYIFGVYSFLTVTLTCRIDVSRFPFDIQYCPIKFEPQSLFENQFNMGFANDQLRLADYTENDEWDVITPVETNNVNNSNSIKSTVHLNLKRRHLFYSIFLISPTIILYLLSGLTFLLPPDSGEKVSFAVTILLAQIVSFGTLSGIFPTSSRNLPILAYFVLAVTVHMSLVCFVASMMVNRQLTSKQANIASHQNPCVGQKSTQNPVSIPRINTTANPQQCAKCERTQIDQKCTRNTEIGFDIFDLQNHKTSEKMDSNFVNADRVLLVFHYIVSILIICLYYLLILFY
ncbi:neuronal acetylcholine receptor subunit beta-4-like [Convolutriloba macropyga]|uniref:neuronal acetylcholine receptor subunit beta-4-like n=1 Tax=Convolutriloba macropyga TaxID=536237 RepID=UPI003F51FB1B